jgi:hypothetical protein
MEKTNFEVITESAEKLAEKIERGCPPHHGDENCVGKSCKACWINWLNSPAKIAKNSNNE